MSDNEKSEIIKALAYNTPIDDIAKIMCIDRMGVITISETLKTDIIEQRAFLISKGVLFDE